MPGNAAINDVLTTARQTIESEKATNPSLAQGTTADKLQNVIQAAQVHLAEKNADEKYQRFVAHSAEAAPTIASVGADAVKGPAQQTAQQMPPIGQLLRSLASSGEFRSTLASAWNWIQQVFAGTVTAGPSVPKTAILSSALQGNAPNEAAAREQEALWLNFAQFMRVLGSKPEYQDAVEGLFTFVDQMSDAVPDAAANDTARMQSRKIFNDARAIIEELAGGYSMTPMIEQARSIRAIVKADRRLQELLFEARQFVEAVLRQPTLLDNQAEIDRGRSLINRATCFAGEYRNSIFVQQFFASVTGLLGAIRNDPGNQRLAAAFKDFGSAFVTTNPDTGATEINTRSLVELRQLIVPLVMEQLRSVPISTIEGSNDTYDFKLDGIILAANDIAPDRVRVKYDNDLEFDFRSLSLAETHKSDLTLHLEGMRTRLDNVHFWYRRKSFPKISDEGIANISLEGDGMDLKFRVRVASSSPFFHVTKVDCDIDRMRIRIVEAKHSALDKIVTSVFSGAIRKRVELAIEERLAVTMQRVEEILNRLAQQAGQAVQSARTAAPSVASKVVEAAKTVAPSGTTTPASGSATYPTGSSS